ncbi:T-lymphocyte surface antigen Ly-9-like [Platichthys flesus]|uniref:T-lymphocyte surface antigen Ly-9-like n=1 Tax=Platichthys flesus TaxID=8260 RepID=UPI002DBDCA0A|nr:T-lymphocyte surface antigen Ly-9-like [Platichthys flesus]XP_062256406.1 T-lymphocyte surface antigen Ly-9-like [Platichthys flesus]
MDGHSSSGPVTVLLLAALTSFALGQGPVYVEEGKPLVLTPPKHGTAIKSVVWQINGNLVAEWLSNNVVFYRSFIGRTELDKSTAQLTVNNSMQSDGGDYKVEINNELQSQVYTVKVIKKVPKPWVEVRTTPCDHTSTKCTLTCEGDPAGTQPLTYSWRKDSGEWGPEQQSNDLIISNDTETKRVKLISCRMKNPVSKEESDPLHNPMYLGGAGYFSPNGLAAGISFSVFAVALVGVGVWKREAIKEKICAGSETESPEEVGSSALNERDGSPSVNQPLNGKPN